MKSSNAQPQKLALLIGSPYDGLLGTSNDVDNMEQLLHSRDFMVSRLCDEDATRDNIRREWNRLIDRIAADDVAVIYYSGHGGIVKSHGGTTSERPIPPRHQFLVPIDYDATTTVDFRGILDVEINDFLRRTTDRTHNVTIIFDCCNSAHIARESGNLQNARIKGLPIRAYDTAQYINTLRRDGHLQGGNEVEENPHAVRIYATDIDSLAYEQERDGRQVGLMTDLLVREIRRVGRRRTSWRTIMLRVRELVQQEHQQQRPQSHGPDKRLPFSMEEIPHAPFHLTMEDGRHTLKAGKVAGVKRGDIYSVYPFAEEDIAPDVELGEAEVIALCGFQSDVHVRWTNGHGLPPEGALAFLKTETQPFQWPIALPDGLDTLVHAVASSQILRRWANGEAQSPLARCIFENDTILLLTQDGIQIRSSSNLTEGLRSLVRAVEQLARAEHLRTLRCDTQEELLTHELCVTLTSGERVVGGGDFVQEGVRVLIRMRNQGRQRIYVSVFSVNIAGNITLITNKTTGGREMASQETYTIGHHFIADLSGLRLSWPSNVPRAQPVMEHLVFVITDNPADLSSLETDTIPSDRRDVPRDLVVQRTLYDVKHFRFRLAPSV